MKIQIAMLLAASMLQFFGCVAEAQETARKPISLLPKEATLEYDAVKSYASEVDLVSCQWEHTTDLARASIPDEFLKKRLTQFALDKLVTDRTAAAFVGGLEPVYGKPSEEDIEAITNERIKSPLLCFLEFDAAPTTNAHTYIFQARIIVYVSVPTTNPNIYRQVTPYEASVYGSNSLVGLRTALRSATEKLLKDLGNVIKPDSP